MSPDKGQSLFCSGYLEDTESDIVAKRSRVGKGKCASPAVYDQGSKRPIMDCPKAGFLVNLCTLTGL